MNRPAISAIHQANLLRVRIAAHGATVRDANVAKKSGGNDQILAVGEALALP